LWDLVKEAGSKWVEHKDARLGAALAYYSIFSIGPLIVIAIAVAGLIFGQDAVRGEVSAQIRGLLCDTGATAVQSMLADASRPRSGIIATVLGISARAIFFKTVSSGGNAHRAPSNVGISALRPPEISDSVAVSASLTATPPKPRKPPSVPASAAFWATS
jgi:Virulence factor BrkB